MLNKYIKDTKVLITVINDFKKSGLTVGMCHGTFDLIHLGHLRHFEEAKDKVDLLIVSVTDDEFINKGPGKPIFSVKDRIFNLSCITFVDYVIRSPYVNAIKNISLVKPNFYIKGPDYRNIEDDVTGNIQKEINTVKKYGGEILFTSSKKYSSRELAKKTFSNLNYDQENYIKSVKKKLDIKNINKIFENFKKVKISLLGEIIIDSYNFCEVVGKSGKEPVLVFKEKKIENYLGGAASICNNLFQFSQKIDFISYIGNKNSFESFIRNRTNKKINLNLITKIDSPTPFKKRIIDSINEKKILGIYDTNDNDIQYDEEKKLEKILQKSINKNDILLVSDYGHGLITNKIAKRISSEKSIFVALNTQLNSSTYNKKRVERYKNINLLIINESELRVELRDDTSKIDILAAKLIKLNNIKNLIITSGKLGCHYFFSNKYIHCPAFGKKIVDKIGSGDAMFSALSLCIFLKIDPMISLLIGSISAAISLEHLGNKHVIQIDKIKNTLIDYLENV